MDGCIDSLGNATVFTALDANSGCCQVSVREEGPNKTVFVCLFGSYRFKRIPFGLANAPATLQRAAVILLNRFKWQTCVIYLDDINVFSDNLDDCLTHLRDVMTIFQDGSLTLELRKCDFFTDTFTYLGHIIRTGRLTIEQARVKSLAKANAPPTQAKLYSFSGLVNIYRRFVPTFSDISASLNALLHKRQPSKLDHVTSEQKDAFNFLR